MIEGFNKYTQNFNLDDSNLLRKYYHSFRVKDLSILIAKSLNLSAEEIKIAEVIGLLHDYGRFPQWEKYQTYKDHLSLDHGDYAYQKLFKDGEITKYYQNKENYNIISKAIKNHNKLSSPENLTSKERLFCQIIRDADKIDILYLYSQKALQIKDKGTVSPQVEKEFYQNKSINNTIVQSEIDDTLKVLAMIYDLNFKYSFNYLIEYHLLECIFETANDKEKLKPYFIKIKNYLKERIW